jgi:membrane fusion protein (multidrug efflux system)
MKPKTGTSWIVAVLAIVGSLPFAACSKTPEKSASSQTAAATASTILDLAPRDVADVIAGRIGSGVNIRGSLDPAHMVQVKATMPGRVSGVMVHRTNTVRAGQVMATLDARILQAQSAGAGAAVAAAERDYAAAEMLRKQGAVAQSDFIRAQAALAAARAQAAGASQGVQDAIITAPMSGTVVQKFIEGNETVLPGQTLFAIADTSELEIVAKVSPSAITQIRVGQPVSLTIRELHFKAVEGRVIRLESVADAGTRQLSVFIRVPNPKLALVAGLYVEGTILTDASAAVMTKVPVVPLAAISEVGTETAVYEIVRDRLERRVVKLGAHDDSRGLVEVVSGLQAPTRVILEPTSELKSGMRVRIAADDEGTP